MTASSTAGCKYLGGRGGYGSLTCISKLCAWLCCAVCITRNMYNDYNEGQHRDNMDTI